MKHVYRYEPDLDLEAVKLRLDVATQRRVYDTRQSPICASRSSACSRR